MAQGNTLGLLVLDRSNSVIAYYSCFTDMLALREPFPPSFCFILLNIIYNISLFVHIDPQTHLALIPPFSHNPCYTSKFLPPSPYFFNLFTQKSQIILFLPNLQCVQQKSGSYNRGNTYGSGFLNGAWAMEFPLGYSWWWDMWDISWWWRRDSYPVKRYSH